MLSSGTQRLPLLRYQSHFIQRVGIEHTTAAHTPLDQHATVALYLIIEPDLKILLLNINNQKFKINFKLMEAKTNGKG